jgi:maleate isomerase
MSDRPAIGVILPSSNRVVERVTRDLLTFMPPLDACFARIPYYGDGQGQPAGRYDEAPFLEASKMLVHARVDVICWNATRGSLLGFAPDRAMAARITDHTGLPVVTTSLAALDAFRLLGIRRIALVTHGAPGPGAEFVARFHEQGIETETELHLGFSDNFAAAHADPQRIIDFAQASATKASVDAILIWSTNLHGHAFAAKLENEIGLPVIDSAALGIWAALRTLNWDTKLAGPRWRLFGALGSGLCRRESSATNAGE